MGAKNKCKKKHRQNHIIKNMKFSSDPSDCHTTELLETA